MNSSQLDEIRLVVHPFEGIVDALRSEICTRQDILDIMFLRKLVHRGKEGVILWAIDMGHSSFEEGELQVSHLRPVDHFRVQVETQLVDQPFNIIDSSLRVPSCIHMKNKGPQIPFHFCHVSKIGAIDPTAHAHDAVKLLALTPAFYLLH